MSFRGSDLNNSHYITVNSEKRINGSIENFNIKLTKPIDRVRKFYIKTTVRHRNK